MNFRYMLIVMFAFGSLYAEEQTSKSNSSIPEDVLEHYRQCVAYVTALKMRDFYSGVVDDTGSLPYKKEVYDTSARQASQLLIDSLQEANENLHKAGCQALLEKYKQPDRSGWLLWPYSYDYPSYHKVIENKTKERIYAMKVRINTVAHMKRLCKILRGEATPKNWREFRYYFNDLDKLHEEGDELIVKYVNKTSLKHLEERMNEAMKIALRDMYELAQKRIDA